MKISVSDLLNKHTETRAARTIQKAIKRYLHLKHTHLRAIALLESSLLSQHSTDSLLMLHAQLASLQSIRSKQVQSKVASLLHSIEALLLKESPKQDYILIQKPDPDTEEEWVDITSWL